MIFVIHEILDTSNRVHPRSVRGLGHISMCVWGKLLEHEASSVWWLCRVAAPSACANGAVHGACMAPSVGPPFPKV